MNKTTLLTGFAAMMLTMLAGCSKQIEEPTAGSDDALIELSGSVLQAEAPQVKAPVGGDPTVDVPALTLYFARADEASDNTYPDYAATAIEATRAAGKWGTATKITWASGSEQYYPISGRKTKLTAWYPGGATADEEASGNGFYDAAAQRVTWKINGQQDVMTATVLEGSTTSALPGVVFKHRLTQVQVWVYAEDAAAAATWGNVTGASVCDQRSLCVCKLNSNGGSSGDVEFKGTATSDFEVYKNASGVAAPTTKATAVLLGTVMIEPRNSLLKLSVATAKCGTQPVGLGGSYMAGYAYKVYLKLQQSTITTAARITDWATPVDQDVNVDGDGVADVPAVGDYYFTDGTFSSKVESGKTPNGLVYYVDPADLRKFKVMALEESSITATPQLTWAANDSYVIGAAAQSLTDGKGNAAAIKAAFDSKTAGVAITESTLDAAFPAAGYCYNYQGKNNVDAKGTWYLPAKNDLQYLYCAFNGAVPVIWLSSTTGAPTSNSTARDKWNALLTASGVGSTGVFNKGGSLWSGTEHSGYTSKAWNVAFSNGATGINDKSDTYFVRCVRDL